MKIFAACHRVLPSAQVPYLIPLRSGAANAGLAGEVLNDSLGDSIAGKNKYYAELTALYWIWKNVDDDILGLCHYRRLFSPFMTPSSVPVIAAPSALAQNIVSVDPLGKTFQCELAFGDVIVPMAMPIESPLDTQYKEHHRAQDWDAAMRAIETVYPDEAAAAKRFFSESKRFHGFNMFIAKREVFRSYCSWLFALFEELDKHVQLPEDPLQCRVFGYLGERLLCWWVRSRSLKVIEKPVVFCTDL